MTTEERKKFMQPKSTAVSRQLGSQEVVLMDLKIAVFGESNV